MGALQAEERIYFLDLVSKADELAQDRFDWGCLRVFPGASELPAQGLRFPNRNERRSECRASSTSRSS